MPPALDDRDIAMLSILSREGRISKTELARRVNLSPTPCWERLKRLEQAGLITGYRAQIAPVALGAHVTTFVMVELESHRPEDFPAFERAANAEDQIVGCWGLGGGYDYLLQTVTRDIDAYQRMMDDLLSGGAGIRRYFTYIVTNSVKAGGPPLSLLSSGG